MAGKEDVTDSPAMKPNEPSENSLSLHAPLPEQCGRSIDDNHGVVTGEIPSLDGTANDGGVLRDQNHQSSMVMNAQQEMLDRYSRGPQTSGGTAPNVDEELCEKKCLKIGHIDPNIFIKACNLLKIHQVHGRDWRGLAGRLGYNVADIKIFECEKNCAESMLCDWNNEANNYLENLVKELRQMKRNDVANLLQKEIDKKGESCNCPDCGHIV